MNSFFHPVSGQAGRILRVLFFISPGFKGGAGRIQPVSRAVPGEFCAF